MAARKSTKTDDISLQKISASFRSKKGTTPEYSFSGEIAVNCEFSEIVDLASREIVRQFQSAARRDSVFAESLSARSSLTFPDDLPKPSGKTRIIKPDMEKIFEVLQESGKSFSDVSPNEIQELMEKYKVVTYE